MKVEISVIWVIDDTKISDDVCPVIWPLKIKFFLFLFLRYSLIFGTVVGWEMLVPVGDSIKVDPNVATFAWNASRMSHLTDLVPHWRHWLCTDIVLILTACFRYHDDVKGSALTGFQHMKQFAYNWSLPCCGTRARILMFPLYKNNTQFISCKFSNSYGGSIA